jgi:hypothetical protein
MKTIRILLGALLATGLPLGGATQLRAQGPAFTYQGRLNAGGAPVNALYEMNFALYDAPTNGNLVGAPVSVAPVPVSNGLFTVQLNFGATPFMGAERWLEITVNLFGSDMVPITLHTRQGITPTPYAFHAVNAANLMSFTDMPMDIKVNGQRALRLEPTGGAPNLIGGSVNNSVGTNVAGATIAGGGSNAIAEDSSDTTISGGASNRIGAISAGSTLGGGIDNRIGDECLWHTISGGTRNLIYGWGSSSTIGGGEGNMVGGDSEGMTIAGGCRNFAYGENAYVTIGGGVRNAITRWAFRSTIAGGSNNHIGDGDEASTIGGGEFNYVEPDGGRAATIAGGTGNRIEMSGTEAPTIGGGRGNLISARFATIPGGLSNTVSGAHGFAAGCQAKALHPGAFVWADHSAFDFSSVATNEFSVRASGGVRFVSATDVTGLPAGGVALAPGSGTWASLSDCNAKENFASVDSRAILDKVAALPISTWNYKAQGTSIRHLGPTAQDFHDAFDVGENDRTITTVDADGVALAAIQGLNQKVESENAKLREENAKLKVRLEKLERLVESAARR